MLVFDNCGLVSYILLNIAKFFRIEHPLGPVRQISPAGEEFPSQFHYDFVVPLLPRRNLSGDWEKQRTLSQGIFLPHSASRFLCLALALSTLLQSSKVPKLFRMERNSRLLPVARKLNLWPALNPVSDMHVEKNGSNCYAWNYFDVVTRNPTQACQQDIHSNCPFVTSSTPRPPIIWNAMRCRRPLQ